MNDGGPAAPVPLDDFTDADAHPLPGMSVRIWLVGQALSHPFTHVDGGGDCSHLKEIASRATWLAEVVLAHEERSTKVGETND